MGNPSWFSAFVPKYSMPKNFYWYYELLEAEYSKAPERPEDKLKNPEGVGRWWAHYAKQTPEEGGADPRNLPEIWAFINAMADPVRVGRMVYHMDMRHDYPPPETAYGPKPLCGNLLMLQNRKLGSARGIIDADPKKMMMVFEVKDDSSMGRLIIRHMPLIYTDSDKLMMAGGLWHELRHAVDFAVHGGLQGVSSGEVMLTDKDAYASMPEEGRAYSDELRQMYRLAGSKQAVMKAIGESFFGMPDSLAKAAEAFFDAWLADQGPAVATAEVFEPPTLQMPPALVKSQADEAARRCAQIIGKILSRYQFKNWVKLDPKVLNGSPFQAR